MKCIINADDLGLSQEVNDAIKGALSKGVITSSTILANTTLWDDVCGIVASFSKASFGVHLNLTQGLAITDSDVLRKYGIVDGNNCFTREIKKVKSLPNDLFTAVVNELDAQVKAVASKGIAISHADGHHHIHTSSALAAVVLDVIKRNGITIIRNRYKSPTHFPHYGVKDYLWRKGFELRGISFTEYFDSYEGFVSKLKKGEKYSDSSAIELMCHPGGEKYKDEMLLVTDQAVGRFIEDVQYVSYKDFK